MNYVKEKNKERRLRINKTIQDNELIIGLDLFVQCSNGNFEQYWPILVSKMIEWWCLLIFSFCWVQTLWQLLLRKRIKKKLTNFVQEITTYQKRLEANASHRSPLRTPLTLCTNFSKFVLWLSLWVTSTFGFALAVFCSGLTPVFGYDDLITIFIF